MHQDARLLNQLAAKCNGNNQELDDRSLTICSGLDMVNINYLHVICESAEQAKVSATSVLLASAVFEFNQADSRAAAGNGGNNPALQTQSKAYVYTRKSGMFRSRASRALVVHKRLGR